MEDIEVVVYDLDYIPDYREAEEERQANEAIRVSNEEGRVEAEGLRVIAEQGRVDAEALRVSAEGDRVLAENGRVSAEADRVLAEKGRVSAEDDRVLAEQAREATINSLATVATSGSYTDLSDKPTIGDATITIQKNSATVDTFELNDTTDTTINITVPTKTSDLSNDSGFIDKTVNNLTNYTTTSAMNLILAGKQNTLNWDLTPTSGSYNAISSGAVYTALSSKQDTLTSGTNIKTINSTSVLGSGNFTLEDSTNKVTSLSGSSTDTQYPSAKCVYDLIGNLEDILEELDIGEGV